VASCVALALIVVGCSAPEGVSHYTKEVPVSFGESFEIPERLSIGAPAIALTPLRYNSETKECLFRTDYEAPIEPIERWIESGRAFLSFPHMEILRLDFVSASEKGAILRVYGARPFGKSAL